jgi:protoporphyrinogen oxidase
MSGRVEEITYLVVGAGVSGLAFANFIDSDAYHIIEADSEIGGYCKTVKKDGFVWDYSGHFFHFKNPDLERYLLDRMPGEEVRVVQKDSRVRYGEGWVDFPFQKNIHQLPQEEFIECMYDLFFREEAYGTGAPSNFQEMLYRKFGRAIAEKFLIPYNEKLYACDLSTLDVDAMGRFFPHADLRDIVRNFRTADNASYNATFTYPRGGAIEYVNALRSEVPDARLSLGERLVSVDLATRTAVTTERTWKFRHLISSVPLPSLLGMAGVEVPAGLLTWNKVLVFNLGFDRKGPEGVHWVYVPSRDVRFYRIGFYDNIFGTDRMSMYVEIGARPDETLDVDAERARVLEDLRKIGIVDEHQLVAEHHVVLDPAYVHITSEGQRTVDAARDLLRAHGVHSVGRYGGWTYCSIEDNMIESRALARTLGRVRG